MATDRRVWLLVVLSVLVVLISRWALPATVAFRWVTVGGYWLMLGTAVLFGRAVIPLVREGWRRVRFNRGDAMVLALIALCSAVWWAHEKPGFKVLSDEVLLLGTSMGMHFERSATYPTRMTDVQGPLQILNRTLDKRPLLFPFLVATVHDLTGYRPENAFHVNRVLGAGFLILIYLLGRIASGSRWAGILAVLLFAGLPLLAQQSAGGGFELLNLLMIVVVALLMVRYLSRPDERALEALVYGGILAASTRYESAIFLVPVAVAAFMGWQRAGRVILSWPAVLSPLFLTVLLMQNRIFSGRSEGWEMASKDGITSPFGLEYLATNLGHALAFFFDFSGYQASSPFFALLGLIAIPFFILWMVRVLRQPLRHDAAPVAIALTGAGLLGVTAIHFLYFWGQYDDPVISRLSLPLHLLMVLAIGWVGSRFIRSDRGWKAASAAAAVAIVAQGVPVMAKHAYETAYQPGAEMVLRREFLDSQPERDFLFVDNDSIFWITHLIPASPVAQIQARKEALAYHLKNHSFSSIFVFQSILVDDETGRRSIDPVDDLGPAFELETVWEKKVETLLFARISRIAAIRSEDDDVVRAPVIVPAAGAHQSVEEVGRARALYLENWIKQLP